MLPLLDLLQLLATDREAVPLASAVSERVRLVGAANTLVRVEDGWHADNTDLPGAVAAVRERFDGPVTGATVLGAGATAASTVRSRLGSPAVRKATKPGLRCPRSRANASPMRLMAHAPAHPWGWRRLPPQRSPGPCHRGR